MAFGSGIVYCSASALVSMPFLIISICLCSVFYALVLRICIFFNPFSSSVSSVNITYRGLLSCFWRFGCAVPIWFLITGVCAVLLVGGILLFASSVRDFCLRVILFCRFLF